MKCGWGFLGGMPGTIYWKLEHVNLTVHPILSWVHW